MFRNKVWLEVLGYQGCNLERYILVLFSPLLYFQASILWSIFLCHAVLPWHFCLEPDRYETNKIKLSQINSSFFKLYQLLYHSVKKRTNTCRKLYFWRKGFLSLGQRNLLFYNILRFFKHFVSIYQYLLKIKAKIKIHTCYFKYKNNAAITFQNNIFCFVLFCYDSGDWTHSLSLAR